MNRFSSKDNVKRIDLGDGDWVEIPALISFREAENMASSGDDAVAVICSLIVAWNLKDENGCDMPVTTESVERLDINVVRVIQKEFEGLVELPKA